ncbi:MAG: hypothetical protein DRI54_05945 [Bacteroidetes bacterium]|nr:MAG: hypothetical protein DRI54_05945 [Bacteroidota bacterium]
MKTIVAFCILLVSIPAIGQVINQIGYYNVNGVTGLAAQDNYMFLSDGKILDNSIPSSPQLVSQFSFNGDGINVIIDDEFAYFGTGMTNEFYIADISNINFPLQFGYLEFTEGNGVFGMDVIENTLMAALGMDGTIVSIDIMDKTNPEILDILNIPGGQCRDVVINGNLAYAAHATGLKVIDITIPSDLQVINSIGGGYNSIDMGDGKVFLGKSSGGIDVFDIDEPENPTPAFAITNTGGTAWDIKYSEQHIYLATNSDGLFIYKEEDNIGIFKANFPNEGNGQSFSVALQDSFILLSGLVNGVAILQYDSTGIVGINEISNDQGFKIYPNPAQNEIFISSDNELQISEINIYNQLGQNVIHQPACRQAGNRYEGSIDVSSLMPGIYFVEVVIGNDRIREKVVIK